MRGKKKAVAQSYPKYSDMIVEAIVALQERSGSSVFAIRKFIGEKWVLPEGWEARVGLNLKKMSTDGSLKKERASFKLGDALKKATKAKVTLKKAVVAPKAKGKKAKTGSSKPKSLSKAAAGVTKKKAGSSGVKPKAAAARVKKAASGRKGGTKKTGKAVKPTKAAAGGVKKVKRAPPTKTTKAKGRGGKGKAVTPRKSTATAGKATPATKGRRSSRANK